MHLHIKKKKKKESGPVTYDKSHMTSLMTERKQEIKDMLFESVTTIQFYPVKVIS